MKKLILIAFLFILFSLKPITVQAVSGCGTLVRGIECTWFEFQGGNYGLLLPDGMEYPAGTLDYYIEGNIQLFCVEYWCPFQQFAHCIELIAISACLDSCANQMPGDVDGSGAITISDLVALMAYLYAGGAAPNPLANGDPNGDCEINIGDVIYLAALPDGPLPVECTCVSPDVGQSACCFNIRGNFDYDPKDLIDISDLVGLIDYMFRGGPGPLCFDEANIDGLSGIDIADIVVLAEFMFASGSPPAVCP